MNRTGHVQSVTCQCLYSESNPSRRICNLPVLIQLQATHRLGFVDVGASRSTPPSRDSQIFALRISKIHTQTAMFCARVDLHDREANSNTNIQGKLRNLAKCLSQRYSKKTCKLVLHSVPLMLSVKQGNCEY